MSHETRRIGQQAEERVAEVFRSIGCHVELGEDYHDKTDLIIDGKRVQISVKPKSKKQRFLLGVLGIIHISAGAEYTDDDILHQFLKQI